MILVPNRLQPSNGNKGRASLRSIYLISKTPYPGVIHLPVLRVETLHPQLDFSAYDGIVVTSKQGASALKAYTVNWGALEVVCVGEATAEEMTCLGAKRIITAQGYGESIASYLVGSDKKWLYLRPEVIASAWPSIVRESGVWLDEAVIYRTRCNDAVESVAVEANGVLIFTSPSSIECFLQNYSILSTHTIIVIGTTTQKALPRKVKSLLSQETSVASCVELAIQITHDSSPF